MASPFAPLEFHRYGLYMLSQWAVMTIAAIGLNLTLGYAGQVSLAQGAFVGIGAYSAAILTTHGWPLGARSRRGDRAVFCRRLDPRLSRACACSIIISPSSRSPSRRSRSSSSATRTG